MKLWDYDADTLLPNLPTMVTFPKLHDFYEDWRKDLESKGVDIRLQTDVTEILQRSDRGVVLQTCPFDPDAKDRMRTHIGPPSKTETFDELVMCGIVTPLSFVLPLRPTTFCFSFLLASARITPTPARSSSGR